VQTSDTDTEEQWSKVVDILSEESGIVAKDLTDEVQFADAGIDSLLS
jgi:acyl carrier protein